MKIKPAGSHKKRGSRRQQTKTRIGADGKDGSKSSGKGTGTDQAGATTTRSGESDAAKPIKKGGASQGKGGRKGSNKVRITNKAGANTGKVSNKSRGGVKAGANTGKVSNKGRGSEQAGTDKGKFSNKGRVTDKSGKGNINNSVAAAESATGTIFTSNKYHSKSGKAAYIQSEYENSAIQPWQRIGFGPTMTTLESNEKPYRHSYGNTLWSAPRYGPTARMIEVAPELHKQMGAMTAEMIRAQQEYNNLTIPQTKDLQSRMTSEYFKSLHNVARGMHSIPQTEDSFELMKNTDPNIFQHKHALNAQKAAIHGAMYVIFI